MVWLYVPGYNYPNSWNGVYLALSCIIIIITNKCVCVCVCICVCVCVCVCWADLSDDNLVVHFIEHIHSNGVVSTHLQHPAVAGGDGETWRRENHKNAQSALFV